MSRPFPTAADLIAQATHPCHHRREPFGPCAICLEEVIEKMAEGMVPEEELILAKATIETLEADHRNDEGAMEKWEQQFEELKGKFESAKSELGEELASMRSELMDKMTKLIEEAENPDDSV